MTDLLDIDLPAGVPCWRSPGGEVLLVNGDAMQIVRLIETQGVDCVVTDIPYSAKTHSGARGAHGRESLVSFASMTNDEAASCVAEFVRIAKRWTIAFSDWRVMSSLEMLPEFVRFGVWTKTDPAPQFSGDRPATGWEAVAILHATGKKRWNGGGRPAVWRTNIVKSNLLHETQKPLDLMAAIIDDFTDAGEIVADPYCGSGTTLVAAVRMGRKAIGIELDPAYFAIAKNRIAAALGHETPGKDGLTQKRMFVNETEE